MAGHGKFSVQDFDKQFVGNTCAQGNTVTFAGEYGTFSTVIDNFKFAPQAYPQGQQAACHGFTALYCIKANLAANGYTTEQFDFHWGTTK